MPNSSVALWVQSSSQINVLNSAPILEPTTKSYFCGIFNPVSDIPYQLGSIGISPILAASYTEMRVGWRVESKTNLFGYKSSTVTRRSFPQPGTLLRALHLTVRPVAVFARRHNTVMIPIKIHIVIPSRADALLPSPAIEIRDVSAIH